MQLDQDYSRIAAKNEENELVRISIIVPVWNEASIIRPFLIHLRAIAPASEIIVVDGGSDDETARLSRSLADLFLTSKKGRARQMNAGAARASGGILWFVHADSIVAAGAIGEIERALCDPRNAGGSFRLRFVQPALVYRISDSLGNLAIDLFGIALGDHGIFCRRDLFEKMGGYPDVPLMEDAEFYRALRRHGRVRQLPCEIVTSPRRYESLGPYRTTSIYAFILLLYLLGLPLTRLDRIYRRMVSRKSERSDLIVQGGSRS